MFSSIVLQYLWCSRQDNSSNGPEKDGEKFRDFVSLPCNALCDQSQQLKFIYLNLFHHHNKNIKIGGRSRRLQQLLFLLDGTIVVTPMLLISLLLP